MNDKKFYELAKAKGLEASDLYLTKSHSLSCTVFHSAIDSYTQADEASLTARGILKGKFGSVTTEIIDRNTPEYLVDQIIKNASAIESDDPAIIYKGSAKYHRKKVYNPEVLAEPMKDKIAILFEIEKKLFAYDKRINEVAGVSYEESSNECYLSNSYGLKLKDKGAYYSFSAEVTAKNGDEIRSGYKVFASLDPNEFDIDAFVKDVAEDALSQLGSTQCVSKRYPIVLNPKTASYLTSFYIGSANAEEVQKHSSLFIGKLHAPVASKKVTIIEDPLQKNVFFRYFDDEGVATNKKFLIKKGSLETYLYTLETAAKEGVEPTGNGYRGGGKAHASTVNVCMKPGRKSEAEMMANIKEGVYITELEGLHAGMNAQSGNFSLQANGFMIRDGKLAEPLALITLAGNLVDLFMNIRDVANNSTFTLRTATTCPSILVKKLSVTGK